MPALDRTSRTFRKTTINIITQAVINNAPHGVFRFADILVNIFGSILSLPNAYEALVAENTVALSAEVDAKITAN